MLVDAWRVCKQVTTRLSNFKLLAIHVRFFSGMMGEQMPVNNNNVFSLPSLSSSNFHDFQKEVTFKALKIPTKSLNILLKKGLKRKAYKRTKFNFVRKGEDEDFCHILLDPEAVRTFDSWKTCPVLQQNEIEPMLMDYKVTLTYEDFTGEEILRAVLPNNVDVPTAFSRIGHIAHVNLREDQLVHKNVIGQVMLDKTQGIKTVVNKTSEISNEYRVFNMEILAGEENFITTVKEHHCTFQLDFSKVYWNPRLSTEHERIVRKAGIKVMFDVFAGIGPFAIPAAKSGCQVYANDLNPDSYKWLVKNAKLNKAEEKIESYNLDGRAFIKSVVKNKLLEYAGQEQADRPMRVHIVMNLPALAVEFLDAFRGLLSGDIQVEKENVPPISVHCYCFSKDEDPQKDAVSKVEHHLGCIIRYPEVHNVRNVAPNKEMMCVSFEIPCNVLWEAKRIVSDDPSEEGGGSKRQKLK